MLEAAVAGAVSFSHEKAHYAPWVHSNQSTSKRTTSLPTLSDRVTNCSGLCRWYVCLLFIISSKSILVGHLIRWFFWSNILYSCIENNKQLKVWGWRRGRIEKDWLLIHLLIFSFIFGKIVCYGWKKKYLHWLWIIK